MKTVVITGASSGMGREVIIQPWEHSNGFGEIWIIVRRMERLGELSHQVGVPLRKFALNLTKDRDLGILERALEKKTPQVKLLVNAAGFGKIGTVDELSLTDERDIVCLNYEALCAVTRMALFYITCNSRTIQFASSAVFPPQPGFAICAATKSLVLNYSKALHQELKSRNIYVTVVCPGSVKTEFFDTAEATGEIPLYKRLVTANPRRVVAKAIRDDVAGRDTSVYGLTMKVSDLLYKVFPHRFILMPMDVINSKVKDCERQRRHHMCRH